MATHVKIIATLFFAYGGVLILGAFFSSLIFGLLGGIVGASGKEDAAVGVAILGLTGIAVTAILLALAVPAFICAWGLLKLRPWARILGIVLAAIALIKFPIGTAFGVYALIILFRKETEALFVRPVTGV